MTLSPTVTRQHTVLAFRAVIGPRHPPRRITCHACGNRLATVKTEAYIPIDDFVPNPRQPDLLLVDLLTTLETCWLAQRQGRFPVCNTRFLCLDCLLEFIQVWTLDTEVVNALVILLYHVSPQPLTVAFLAKIQPDGTLQMAATSLGEISPKETFVGLCGPIVS